MNDNFPGGTLDGNPPANAGDMGLIPGPGRFHMAWATKAHVPQLLSPCAGTTEAWKLPIKVSSHYIILLVSLLTLFHMFRFGFLNRM